MRRVVCFACIIASLVLTPKDACAGTTGGISGHFFDQFGEPHGPVKVTFMSFFGDTETTTSDTAGFYAFVSLPPGPGYLGFSDLGSYASTWTSVWADQMRTVDVKAFPYKCLCHPRYGRGTLVWLGIADSVWSFGPDGRPLFASLGR